MKNKIITLIIGCLIGAIITTAVFLIIEKVNGKNTNTQPPTGIERNGKMGDFRPDQMNSDNSTNDNNSNTKMDRRMKSPQQNQTNSNSTPTNVDATNSTSTNS